jgi:hypothetical protein
MKVKMLPNPTYPGVWDLVDERGNVVMCGESHDLRQRRGGSTAPIRRVTRVRRGS